MKRQRKTVFHFTWLAMMGMIFLGVQASSVALAEYPERPVEIVVKGGPGSGINQLGHFAAKLAPKYLGQPMACLYKKGGSGAVAQAYIQKKPADGYRVFMDTTTTAIVLAQGKVPFTEKNWQGVIRLQVDPQGVAVRSDSPWKNFKDLAEWIRKNPGKVRWAGSHAVGIDPYTVALLLKAGGLDSSDIKYVPAEGASHMTTMLLGKHIEVATLNPREVKEQEAAGNFRVLGMGHQERLKDHPNWPTFKEQGFDVVVAIWRGALIKAGTPAPVVKKLHDTFNAMRQDSAFVQFLKNSAQLDGYMGGPEKFHPFFVNQVQEMRRYFAKQKK
jgi:putative tricarboxylic transport membrane protein